MQISGADLTTSDLVELISRKWIDYIQTINLINTINTIVTVQTINSILKINEIVLVDTITTLGTVNLVSLITKISEIVLVDTITTLGTVNLVSLITKISEIVVIDSVTIANVKTTGGSNIIIDLLQQGSYLERQSTLQNNGAVTAGFGNSIAGVEVDAKFFPRGTRGFISTVNLYCEDTGNAGGTITAYLCIAPGMSPIISSTVTVPASGVAAWRSATFNYHWNYDSLFIYYVSSTAFMQIAFDGGSPGDAYYATNNTVTNWVWQNARRWVSVTMTGETIGDIPVSGIVNNIPIPNIGVSDQTFGANCPQNAETSVQTVNGSGYCDYVIINLNGVGAGADAFLKIYCDGILVLNQSPSALNNFGILTTSAGIALLGYSANSGVILVTKKLEFKRTINVSVYVNAFGAATTANGTLIPSLIS